MRRRKALQVLAAVPLVVAVAPAVAEAAAPRNDWIWQEARRRNRWILEQMRELTVSFPGLAEWHRVASMPHHLTISKLEDSIEGAVLAEFGKFKAAWSDFETMRIKLLLKGEPWGHEGNFPDPYVKVENLHTQFGTGLRLKELVARGVQLAGAQIDAPFRAQRIDFIKLRTENAPDFGGDYMAEVSYSRRMHRQARERFSAGDVVPSPDEVQLVFLMKGAKEAPKTT